MKYQNIDTKERRGSYGGMTSTAMKDAGATINVLKSKVPKRGKDAKMTYDQRANQADFATKVAAWKGLKDQTEISYERSKPCQSMLDMFLENNKGVQVPLLSKQEAERGTQLLANYVISNYHDALGHIDVRTIGDKHLLMIALGSLSIDADTTVGQFSAAVKGNNGNQYLDGDAITLISARQIKPIGTHSAKIEVLWDKVELADSSTPQGGVKLSAVAPNGFFQSINVSIGGASCNYLYMPNKDYQMVAPVQSRKGKDKKTVCSDQSFVGTNPYLDEVNASEQKKYDAVLSYGPVQRANNYRPSVALHKVAPAITLEQFLGGELSLSASGNSGNPDPTPDQGSQGGNNGGGNNGGGSTGGGSIDMKFSEGTQQTENK